MTHLLPLALVINLKRHHPHLLHLVSAPCPLPLHLLSARWVLLTLVKAHSVLLGQANLQHRVLVPLVKAKLRRHRVPLVA